MTNERAIELIKPMCDSPIVSHRLSAMFAMQDIIHFDVEEWLKMPLHIGLESFVTHGETVTHENFPVTDDPEDINRFRQATIAICESMVGYARIHDRLTQESESER